ncbi:hypothetical protein [Flexithrix dorotheae]|uniref:hypothetical protein n=1 Tax=Flexithrix dorotheae TaxID=70993 RepID=UPI00036E30E3|nr:hypothetical protein [Flexithrix dorotheae]
MELIIRKIFVSFVLFLFGAHSYGQKVLTLSMNPNIPAQYGTLDEAMAAASTGDTLYIHPAKGYYDGEDSLVLDKALVLIGGGFYNGSDEFAGEESKFNKIVVRGEGDNSVIANLYIDRLSFESSNDTDISFDNITVKNNYISRIDLFTRNGAFSTTGISIRKNIIPLIFFNGWESIGNEAIIDIENNIIGQIANGGGNRLTIRNNMFNPRLFGTNSLFEINNATIINNIFYGYNDYQGIGISTCSFCIFERNLSYRVSDEFVGGQGNIIGANNLENLNPSFTSGTGEWTKLSQIMAVDLTLKEGSPAIGSGSEGTNIGISGGRYPYNQLKRFAFPHVKSIDINAPVIGVDDMLRFTIKGEFPQN